MTMTAKTALTMELTPRVSARFSVRFSALPSLHQRGLGAAEMQSALPQRSADGRQGRLGVGPPLLRRQCSGQDLVAAMIVVGSDDVVRPAARRPRGRASVSARRRGSSSSIEDGAPTLSRRIDSILDHADGGDSGRREEDRTTRPTIRRSDRIQAASDDRKRRRSLSVTLSPRISGGGGGQCRG